MRKGIIKHGRKFIATFLASVVVITAMITPTAFAKTLADKFEVEGPNTGIDNNRAELSETKYKDYLDEWIEKGAVNYQGQDIVLTPKGATCIDRTEDSTTDNPEYKKTPLTDREGKEAIGWDDTYGGFEWVFNAPESGFYYISLEYYYDSDDELGINAIRELAVNGKVPFSEASELVFKKWWVDEVTDKMVDEQTGKIRPNRTQVGDDITPELVHVSKWTTTYLRDADGYYMEPFKVYFEKGENKITLYCSNRQMLLGNIILSKPVTYKSYAEYASQFTNDGKNASEWKDLFEAEDIERIVFKSSNQMRLTSGKDASLYPFDSGYTRINQIGGETNWYENRDSYTWSFEVPKDGWYKISLRVANNVNIGMPVYRQIYIDDEIPFEEFLAYKFKYSYNYYTTTLGDADGNAYCLYLEKGKHTLKMETILGELGDVALTFYKQANDLNVIIREIKKILGPDPDPNYNYRLSERIENLDSTLNGLVEVFNQLIAGLTIACDTDSSSMINDLKGAIDTIMPCIQDSSLIPKRMGDIESIQTSLGTWISKIESSALMIDFIEIGEPGTEATERKASFWKSLGNLWTSFIVSFKKDYNVAYDQLQQQGKEVIEVWMSKDREYADMIVSLMDEYLQNTDYAVKLRIVPGQIGFGGFNLLLLSYMTHNEPDMTFGCGDSDCVNYAIRGTNKGEKNGIAYNIEKFDDYEEVVQRFCEGSMIGLKYSDNTGERNGTFGLPETSSMSVAFYRTDIFNELGIAPPETWDELFDEILPLFYRENYLLSGVSSDMYLYQMNGYPYRSQNRLSGYDTEIAYKAFNKHFDQYLVYGLDLSVNTFQGFRDGDVPYMLGEFGTYTQLMTAAPELMGRWAIAAIPGTYDELGVLNRTIPGGVGGSALMILDRTDHPDECWDLMKWWTSGKTQIAFEYMVEAKFGSKNRWASANKEAFLALPWTAAEKKIIEESFNWYITLPVILGSYQQTRYASFANNQVLIQGKNARDAIEEMIDYINPELVRKQAQYGIEHATDEEINDKTYDTSAKTVLTYYQKLREEKLKELEAAKKEGK